MTTLNFKAEDWVYVADSMGRIGKGYYKNKNNASQTITPEEFERRRAQPYQVQEKNREQNINKKTQSAPIPSEGSGGLLSPASEGATDLTPWDNPIKGEETAQSQDTASSAKQSASIKQTTQAQQNGQGQNRQQYSSGEGANGAGPGGATSNGTEDMGPESGMNNASGSGGSGSGSSVICTELVRQGLMSNREHKLSTLYAVKELPESFMAGYQFWAVPYVRLMRRSGFATKLITLFVMHRTREIYHRLGLAKKGSVWGKFICALHDPFCALLGRFVAQTDYQSLYHKETAETAH